MQMHKDTTSLTFIMWGGGTEVEAREGAEWGRVVEVVKAETLMELLWEAEEEEEEEMAWKGPFNYSCSSLHTDTIIHHSEREAAKCWRFIRTLTFQHKK